jgi:hypothetical protein
MKLSETILAAGHRQGRRKISETADFGNRKWDCTRPLTLHPPAYLSPNRLTIKHHGNLVH